MTTAADLAAAYADLLAKAGRADFRTAEWPRLQTEASKTLVALWAAQAAEREDREKEVGK